MRITVIGKQHMEGVSKKTGKSYDFNVVHYNSIARGVEGLAAKQLTLDPTLANYKNIIVGNDYEVEFDEGGYPIDFAPID